MVSMAEDEQECATGTCAAQHAHKWSGKGAEERDDSLLMILNHPGQRMQFARKELQKIS